MWVDYLSISANRLVGYASWEGERSFSAINRRVGKDMRLAQSGISFKSIKRLQSAINTLVLVAKFKSVYSLKEKRMFRFKINFITLTLPSVQVHDDKKIVSSILVPFLADIKRKRPWFLYVWKAEVQSNGNIHFHLTTNIFYHHRKLRRDWNRYCERLNYVSNSNIEEPNSTDVHSVKGVRNIAAYLTSYVSKKDLYHKELKRYHHRFDSHFKTTSANFCQLPKNYFKYVKRQVTCARWNASAALKAAKARVYYNESVIQSDLKKIELEKGEWSKSEYAEYIYLKSEELKNYKKLFEIFKYNNQELFLSQKSAVTKIEVDSFF